MQSVIRALTCSNENFVVTDWRSFSNALSVDIGSLLPRITARKNLPISALQTLQGVDKNFSLAPFKVVTLGWLISQGKAVNTGEVNQIPMTTTSGTRIWGRFYTMKFSATDPYLPLGDLYVDGLSNTATTLAAQLEKVPVVLIQNKPEFCTIIDASAWTWVTDRYKCSDNNEASLYSVMPPLGTTYKTNYTVVGSAYNPKSKAGGAYEGRSACLAAVHKNFLSTIGSGRTDSRWEIGDDSGSGCYNDIDMMFSTSFYTFRVRSNTSSWLGLQTFVDFIPLELQTKCCVDNLPSLIASKNPTCGVFGNATSVACTNRMRSHCTGDNLLTDECYLWCKNNDCNANLKEYCSSDSADKTAQNFERTCSCFFNQSFYDNWRSNTLSELGPNIANYLLSTLPPVVPKCDYPQCSNTLTLKPFEGASPVACRPTNIQQCINSTISPISGTLTESSIDTSQAIDCVQSFAPEGMAPPPRTNQPPSTPPPPPKRSNGLYIGIGVAVVVIIAAVVIMKRK
jgi:hypothetical protein